MVDWLQVHLLEGAVLLFISRLFAEHGVQVVSTDEIGVNLLLLCCESVC